jgi:hypothetical protein
VFSKTVACVCRAGHVPHGDHSPPLEPRLAHVLRSGKLSGFATTRVWHEPTVAVRKKEISSAAGVMVPVLVTLRADFCKVQHATKTKTCGGLEV